MGYSGVEGGGLGLKREDWNLRHEEHLCLSGYRTYMLDLARLLPRLETRFMLSSSLILRLGPDLGSIKAGRGLD